VVSHVVLRLSGGDVLHVVTQNAGRKGVSVIGRSGSELRRRLAALVDARCVGAPQGSSTNNPPRSAGLPTTMSPDCQRACD
jgi:hypothetical protein